MVEAGPGTGKTLTAAERFGHLAHDPSINPHRGVLVLTFTVGATTVVQRAIRQRWGHASLSWPHRAQTFDSVFRSILEFLLRSHEIVWPQGLLAIDAIDEWQELNPAPGINPLEWVPCLRDGRVGCRTRRVEPGSYVVTAKKRLMPQLERGCCTHDAVRDLVLQAVADPTLRLRVVEFLRTLSSCVLVDEAFDANETDVQLLQLFVDAGCSLSLVGDPWQALYGFRDAEPELLESVLLGPLNFERQVLEECFRFDSPAVIDLMSRLRAGEACPTIGSLDFPDVVLAPEWKLLWGTAPNVMPLAFGQVRTKIDAVSVLLLDTFLQGRGMSGARLAGGACKLLRIEESAVRQAGAMAFGPVFEVLQSDKPGVPEQALDMLSRIPKDHFGAAAKLPVGEKERARHAPRLEALRERLRFDGTLIPGLTVHQAKGEEWDRVAVVLSDADIAALSAGLRQQEPEDRRLYVSLTRARKAVGRFPT